MTGDGRERLGLRLLRVAVLGTGVSLAVGGCGTLRTGNVMSFDSAGLILGSETKTKALRKKVEDDSFPTAASVGL